MSDTPTARQPQTSGWPCYESWASIWTASATARAKCPSKELAMLKRTFISGLCLAALLTSLISAATVDTRLASAAMNGDLNAVRALISQKLDVNVPQGDGMTALHWAAYKDDLQMAQALIAAGANVKVATRNGAITPITFAARNGNPAMIELFLKAGADANTAEANGTTVLMN